MLSAGRGPRVTEGTFFPRGCSPAASPSYKSLGGYLGKIHTRLSQWSLGMTRDRTCTR